MYNNEYKHIKNNIINIIKNSNLNPTQIRCLSYEILKDEDIINLLDEIDKNKFLKKVYVEDLESKTQDVVSTTFGIAQTTYGINPEINPQSSFHKL